MNKISVIEINIIGKQIQTLDSILANDQPFTPKNELFFIMYFYMNT